MKPFYLFALFVIFYGAALGQAPGKKYFKSLNKIISSKTEKGKPNYEKIIADSVHFKNLIYQTQIADISNETDNYKKAFYVDAYNLSVISLIVKYYPIKSVKNIPGFFDSIPIIVGNTSYTLHQLEDKINNEFTDWKLHWALVNGAKDAPPLKFYNPNDIEYQLKNQVYEVYNNPHYVQVDDDSETVSLNSNFSKWEKEITGGKNIKVHLNEYVIDALPYSYNVIYKPFNWNLNNSFNKSSKNKSDLNSAHETKLSKKDSLKFNVDDGLDLPSYLIPKHRLEVRPTNTFYTQTSYYNNKGNRIDDSSRFTYNNFGLKATYGITNDLNVGALFSMRDTYKDSRKTSPFELFNASLKEKGIYNNLQLFCKSKIYQRKTQITLTTFFTIPLKTILPGETTVDDNNRYLLHAILTYDAFITSFIRTSINLEGGLNYDSKPNTITPKFKPSILFSSLIYSDKKIRFTAGVDFDWNYNSLNFVNFIAREYVVINYKVVKKLSLNTSYNYYFIGKNSGAGHSFVFGGAYLF